MRGGTANMNAMVSFITGRIAAARLNKLLVKPTTALGKLLLDDT
jgi:hypothetical protein